MSQAAVALAERLRVAVKEYERQTGQSPLSLRELSRQMCDAGVQISHESLRNILSGHRVPSAVRLLELVSFFGTSFLAFDRDSDPRCVRMMGRLARLDDAGRAAVENFLDSLERSDSPDSRSS